MADRQIPVSEEETIAGEGHLPSVAVPTSLLIWFVLWGIFAVYSKTGHGELDVGEAAFGILFFASYPFVLVWLLVASVRHLKHYRFNPLAPASSHIRTYVWCFTSGLYLLGLAAFIALEGFGLKRYL